MISVCTVTLNKLEPFTKIFCKSIVESTTVVNEVVIINAEMGESINTTWREGKITFRMVGGRHDIFKVCSVTSMCAQHAHGLHQGVELAKNDYVLISDPDIFFYTNIDEFYLKLAHEHDLNFIGISRPDALAQSIGYFPCIMNLFTKKEYLPTRRFLSDFDLGLLSDDNTYQDKIPDRYFYPDTPEKYKSLFPNPTGHYETGCNLLVWAKEKNYNWLSFQTPDCNTYYSKYYKSNFKPKGIPNKKLLYHTWLATLREERFLSFTEAYKNSVDQDC
jgi:hypothetical protein